MRIIKFIILIVFMQSTFGALAQMPLGAQKHLGISLKASDNDDLITYGIITVYEDEVINIEIIDESVFFDIASGQLVSDVNVEVTNKFKQSVFNSEPGFKNSKNVVKGLNNKPTRNLWKMRYPIAPEEETTERENPPEKFKKRTKGWASAKNKPSIIQMQILGNYGIKSLSDFTYGKKAFQLIEDTSDPMWIASYKAN